MTLKQRKERGMKYYYTDPLAAAWMAKHFNMALEFKDAETGVVVDVVSWAQVVLVYGGVPTIGAFYIHPDSEHILEPQAGDETLWINPKAIDAIWRYAIIGFRPINPDNEVKIIRRNDIAFMWPEVEA